MEDVQVIKLEGDENIDIIQNKEEEVEQEKNEVVAEPKNPNRLILPSEKGLEAGKWREEKTEIQTRTILALKIKKYMVKYPNLIDELGLNEFNFNDLSEDDLSFIHDRIKTHMAISGSDEFIKRGLLIGISTLEKFYEKFDPAVSGLSNILSQDPEFALLQQEFAIEYSSSKVIPLEARIVLKIAITYLALSHINRTKKRLKENNVSLSQKEE